MLGHPLCPAAFMPSHSLAGSARHGASRYTWRVFNDDGQSDTHRSCCQTHKHGPEAAAQPTEEQGLCSWLGGSCRQEAGGSVALTLSSPSRDGRCGQRTANGHPAQPHRLEHLHGTCRALLSPPVINGTKQQFQENWKKRVLGRI